MKKRFLRDIAEIQTGPFGSQLHKEDYVDVGTPIVTVEHLGSRVFTEQNLPMVSDTDKNRLSKYVLKKGDIVFSRVGSVDRCSFVDQKHNGWMFSGRCLRVRPSEEVDSMFLYYFFCMNTTKEFVRSIAVGATMPSINTKLLGEVEVVCPEIEEQRKIADILSKIDDKIEENQKINENLEQQVQTLFADWLSANSESATEIALGNICTKVTDGSHFSPKDDSTSSIPMLSVKDMREFDFDLTSCKHICEDDYEKMVANDCVPQVNDILVAKDGSYLKEIFICNEKRKLAILSSIAIFRPNTTVIHPEILLAFLKSPRVLQEVRDNYVSGSALPRIVLKDFKKLTFSLPNMDAQNLIAPLFASIREQIAVNVAENKYMTQLRDTLLPKLMSGELNVDNINL